MEDYLIGIIISGVVAFVFLVVIITILSMHCYRKYTLEKIYVKRKYVSDHTPNGTLPTVSHYLESGARPHPYAVNGYPYTTVPQRHLAAYRPKVLNTEDIYPNENHKEREKKAKTFNGPYSSRPNGDIGHDLSKYKVRRAHRQPDWTLKAYEESGITIDLEEEVTPRDSSFKSNHSTEKVTVGENNNSRVIEPDNADFTIVDYVATDRSPQRSPAPPIKPPSDNNTEAFDHHPYKVRLRPVDNPDESKPKVVDHTRQRKAHEGENIERNYEYNAQNDELVLAGWPVDATVGYPSYAPGDAYHKTRTPAIPPAVYNPETAISASHENITENNIQEEYVARVKSNGADAEGDPFTDPGHEHHSHHHHGDLSKVDYRVIKKSGRKPSWFESMTASWFKRGKKKP